MGKFEPSVDQVIFKCADLVLFERGTKTAFIAQLGGGFFFLHFPFPPARRYATGAMGVSFGVWALRSSEGTKLVQVNK